MISKMLVWVAVVMVIPIVTLGQKKDYYMDNTQDCGKIGTETIADGVIVNIYAKTGSGNPQQGSCTMNFMAATTDATLRVEFPSFNIQSCQVFLQLSGGGSFQEYKCGDTPSSYFSIGRTVGITLSRRDQSTAYSFTLNVIPVPRDRFPPASDSNPASVGLIAGLVGSIFGLIFIASCIGVCCFRKYKARGSSKSPYLYESNKKNVDNDELNNSASVGYTNESLNGSPFSKKKLLAHSSDSSEENKDLRAPKREFKSRFNRENTAGNGENTKNGSAFVIPPAPPAPKLDIPNGRRGSSSEENRDVFGSQERGIDVEVRPKNPLLGALKSNPKFQNTFSSTERDAEERAKRISSSSSFEKLGEAPRPPASNTTAAKPSLPAVPKSPKGRKPKTAGIQRAPRPLSMSDEEVAQIERGLPKDGQDPNIKVLHDNSTSSSSSEIVPISVKNNANEKRKPDTKHGLRPDRTAKGKKQQTQSVSSYLDPDPVLSQRGLAKDRLQSTDGESERPRNQKDRTVEQNREPREPFEKMGAGRYSKGKGRKSPRPGKGSGRGFSHRRGRSADRLDQRPTTPLSSFGSMEDLESLPQLQRASSKSSLYSSRSSLYDRRRRRKGSTGSYVSYRDDISVGKFSDEEDSDDGYVKPLSRMDKERMYRSDNDLGRRKGKEIATQTLRETATQTGDAVAVSVENKLFFTKKKKRSRNVSSSGTQTTKKDPKEAKLRSKSTDQIKEKDKVVTEKDKKIVEDNNNVITDKEKKETKNRKTKRAKSVNALDTEEDEVDMVKPKPKPKPRKSTSANTILDDLPKSASQGNLADPNLNLYNPGMERFQPQQVPVGYPAAPGMQPTGYPGQPGVTMQPPYPMYPPPSYPATQYPPQTMVNVPVHVPKQRNKSNWEMLCEMTDGQKARDEFAETGSVASSVFTNNPAYGNPPGNPYYGNQQFYNYPVPPGPIQQPIRHVSSNPEYENAYTRAKSNENTDLRAGPTSKLQPTQKSQHSSGSGSSNSKAESIV
ncbi:uncharacterized protein LOC127879336 [Dreissena polymorpha]|uniref:CUB domain-containing protein n=1 Tax=Dreissena polymorpha TaxID=45954 RepID=A0A9D4RWF4_DREPO|nr:uncharacterized protein LOC127879336 [Dreissena polymorpha]KAH3881102.1 hypothetical protein DPMN_005024 [Dreissena polymorpha]